MAFLSLRGGQQLTRNPTGEVGHCLAEETCLLSEREALAETWELPAVFLCLLFRFPVRCQSNSNQSIHTNINIPAKLHPRGQYRG